MARHTHVQTTIVYALLRMSTGFSPLRVSTTTVIAPLRVSVDILSVAKYLPLDDIIVGIKMVYARGSSSIMRGVVRIPPARKKKNREGFYKDFYNQVTCTIRLPPVSMESDPKGSQRATLVSCKVFHNGTLHITGSHSRAEAATAVNYLLSKLRQVQGAKIVTLEEGTPFLKSHDNLIYNTCGDVTGWSTSGTSHMNGEFVELRPIDDVTDLVPYLQAEPALQLHLPPYVFVSERWVEGQKQVYTMNGRVLGTLRLGFDQDASRRFFQVQYGCIYVGHRIVGKESFTSIPELNLKTIASEECERRYLIEKRIVVRTLAVFEATCKTVLSENIFQVHMINTFFQGPFRINRSRLHRCFLDNGLYSRLEPCDNAAVNLRFHYNSRNHHGDARQQGRCFEKNKQACLCKDISVSCFNSGKMNVAGLANMEQAEHVYAFMQSFFTTHRATIESTT